MVAVPTHAAADVEEQTRDEEEHGGNFVGEGFGGMEVAGVEADGLLPRDGVAEIKFVRAGDVAFRADAEEFALHGVDFVLGGEFFREDGVERFEEALAGGDAVDFLAAGLEVEGVEVEAVFAGDEGENLFEVRAQLAGCAGTARIVSVTARPPPGSPAEADSRPPTSSPCQQWTEIRVRPRVSRVFSVSTPRAA